MTTERQMWVLASVFHAANRGLAEGECHTYDRRIEASRRGFRSPDDSVRI